jgi:hypothetical protein
MPFSMEVVMAAAAWYTWTRSPPPSSPSPPPPSPSPPPKNRLWLFCDEVWKVNAMLEEDELAGLETKLAAAFWEEIHPHSPTIAGSEGAAPG